jgi:SAM-dependent methyltransferase
VLENSWLTSVYRALPPSARRAAGRAKVAMKAVSTRSLRSRLFQDKAHLVPPLYLMDDGPRDYAEFKQDGVHAFEGFLAAGLGPEDRILDIGSGIGRKTIPLLDFVTEGSYEGIDVAERQVRWCSERITPAYPNFLFRHVDVWSKRYNPKGKTKPSEYRLPFADGEFDFLIVGSVFTHMFPADVRHYVSEIARVLKPSAKGWLTFFLLNEESLALIAAGQSTLDFAYQVEEGSRADNNDRLETAVAHQESYVLETFRQYGLAAEIEEYGSWCGRRASYCQDVVRLRD